MNAQTSIVVPPAGPVTQGRPAVQLTADPDGFRVALALVADPYAAWSYDSPSLLRAGAALRTLYGGEHPEPPQHRVMRAAENWAAAVVRCRIAAEADATAATLPAEAVAPAAGGGAPRIRPMAPAPSGAPSAPAMADAWAGAAELERKRAIAESQSRAAARLGRLQGQAAAVAPAPAWGAGSPDDF